MPNRRPDLSALIEAGGGTRRETDDSLRLSEISSKTGQRSREGTVPITVMQREEVRTQLKLLAVEQRDTIENMVAQALNSLFAKYGKPEIASLKKRKSQ